MERPVPQLVFVSRRAELLAVALSVLAVGAIYVALLAGLPRASLWSGDQGAKLVQLLSLIRARGATLAIADPSLAYAPDGGFSPLPAMYTVRRGDASYGIFSYPYALATAPFFFVLGYAGLYVVPVLATLGTLAVSAALGARLGLRRPWLAPLALGLATPLGFYALVFWEHALATMLATAALLCATWAVAAGSEAQRKRWWLLAAGLLAGLAWWLRAETLWVGPALLAGLAWATWGTSQQAGQLAGGAALAWCAAGLAAGLLPMIVFNLLLYGQPLGAQVAVNYGAPGAAAAFLPARLGIAGDLLVGWSAQWPLWLAAWACALALIAAPERLRPLVLAALAACAAAGLLLTQPRDLHWTGLANAATLTLIAPLGLRLLRRGPATRLIGGAAGLYVLGVLLTAPNGGGAQLGPRYLLPILPAIAVLALMAGQALVARGAARRALAAGALAVLLATGLLVQLRGLDLLRRNYELNQRIVQVVNARPAPLIVTDSVFGPQLLAPLFFERPMLLVDPTRPWPRLVALLSERGERAFTYLTDMPRDAAPAALHPLGVECRLVEGLAHGLSAFDCVISTEPVAP